MNPEYASAYIGKLCAELRIQTETSLPRHEKPLDSMSNFQKALRFADSDYKSVLMRYNQENQKLIETKKNEEHKRAEEKRKRDEEQRKSVEEEQRLKRKREEQERLSRTPAIYVQLVQRMNRAIATKTPLELLFIAKGFKEIGFYADSLALSEQCETMKSALYREEVKRDDTWK